MGLHDRAGEKAGPEGRKRPLRIAIVAPRIQNLVGGQEVQADLLLRLWRDDPELNISYIATNLALPRWLERIPYLRTVVRFPIYMTRLLRGLRKVDIAHIFSAASTSFLIATVPAFCVSRMLGNRVLINYRSGLARDHLSASWIARNILRRADGVVVPSAFLVEVFGDFHVRAQAIPNVVDVNLFSYRGSRFGRSCYAHATWNPAMESIWWYELLHRSKKCSLKRGFGYWGKDRRKTQFAVSSQN